MYNLPLCDTLVRAVGLLTTSPPRGQGCHKASGAAQRPKQPPANPQHRPTCPLVPSGHEMRHTRRHPELVVVVHVAFGTSCCRGLNYQIESSSIVTHPVMRPVEFPRLYTECIAMAMRTRTSSLLCCMTCVSHAPVTPRAATRRPPDARDDESHGYRDISVPPCTR